MRSIWDRRGYRILHVTRILHLKSERACQVRESEGLLRHMLRDWR